MNYLVKLILFAIIFLVPSFSDAQVKFRKVMGSIGYDYGMSAKQTTDKGYIICGATSSFGTGNSDMFALKTDSLGIPKLQKTYGGINVDRGACIRQTTDKGYIMVGYTNSAGAGGYDVYLIKIDSLLQPQWTKTYGGSDWDFGKCVEQTTDGGYIICGSTYTYGQGNEDYYLIKTNSSGDTLWTKTFGGVNEDVANSVVQTIDGGYILTGTSKSMGDTLGDIYTVKTNSLGDTTWTNKFGGTHLDYGNDILESRFGRYIIGGESQSLGNPDSDGIIVVISTTGSTIGLMYRTYLPDFDNVESIAEDTSGRIAMTGRTITNGDAYGNGDVYFSLINKDWGFINATTFGATGYDKGCSIEPTKDKGFIICGYTTSFNNFLDDIYLIKTDSTGIAGSGESLVSTNIQSFSSSINNSESKLFPNPASTSVSFYSEKIKDDVLVQVFDVIGNLLQSEKINQNQKSLYSINISDLANGIYILNISKNGDSFSQKLIIQHE